MANPKMDHCDCEEESKDEDAENCANDAGRATDRVQTRHGSSARSSAVLGAERGFIVRVADERTSSVAKRLLPAKS